MIENIRDTLFDTADDSDFQQKALEVFRFQAEKNEVYREFIIKLGKDPSEIKTLFEIPFLPVELFKTHRIITGDKKPEIIFESSRTTGSTFSSHFVADRKLYEESFLRTFRMFYGDPEDYFIATLLPSYMERKNSSLIYMMNELIKLSGDKRSGFFRDNIEEMICMLKNALAENKKILLMGVSFALYDLARDYHPDLSGVIVMETGGMKGRRKEMIREELHAFLREKLNVQQIHSEYGMTELLSQAYSKGDGIFYCPPWMRILIRDPQDPLAIITEPGKTGGISIIDLANLYSCSFLATGDLGKLHREGGFEVLGRFDNSDIRGCNLLAL